MRRIAVKKVLSREQIDQLALEGLCVMATARQANSYAYDITGYQRVERRDTPFGQFCVWDIECPPSAASLPPHLECAMEQPYLFRLAGLERRQLFTPDEIGKTLRDNYVLHCDGPGNGKCESVMIARKYGLRPYFELSPWGLARPITRAQMERFRAEWERQVLYVKAWCQKLGSAFGMDLITNPEQIWVVLAGDNLEPPELFVERVNEEYEEVNADFRSEYGFDLYLDHCSNSTDVAKRIRLWEYVRRRYSEFLQVEAEVVRRHLSGRLVGNVEFDTEVDYSLWGQVYDIPGFNVRPALFSDELGYRHWVGYGTALARDLTGRAPMISVRTNMVAAGPRIIPTRAATRYWYSQAVRNGAMGFYIWVRDFPGDLRDPHAYSGPCMGNPDNSTRPLERWQTHLEIAKQLGRTKVFRPPAAETGILVSIPSCAAGGWPWVFSAYIEACLARVFVRFVSSVQLRESTRPLEGLRLLIIPRAPFEHQAVIERLHRAVEAGLLLIVADSESFAWDECGNPHKLGADLLHVSVGEPRGGCEAAVLELDGQTIAYRTYRPGRGLTPAAAATVSGRFRDGAVAAVERRLGRGRVITLGAPLFDIYASGATQPNAEDPNRRLVLRHWCERSAATTHDWVFDVDLDTLPQITGTLDVQLPPVNRDIQFAPFMYVHGG